MPLWGWIVLIAIAVIALFLIFTYNAAGQVLTKDDPGTADIPVIFVTATDGSQPLVVNLTNLGAWLRDGSLDVSIIREWVQGPLASTSQDRIVTVFMPLSDEGVAVWRPVDAEALPSGWYRIVSVNEQPDDETWAFPTDAVVACEHRRLADGERLVVSGGKDAA